MKRRSMSQGKSRKQFRKNTGVHRFNLPQSGIMRGGIRR